MKNLDTEEVYEVIMSNAEREQFLKDNPNIKQVFTRFPATLDSVRLGRQHHSDGFNDVLKEIKKKHYKSDINTR
jgi:hypothetical protein